MSWMGGVAIFGLLAYLFTPLSAAGAEGAPVGFGINIRYAIPPLLLGLTLLPIALWASQPISGVPFVRTRDKGNTGNRRRGLWGWGALVALLLVLVASDRSDAVLRDPARLFGLALAFLVVVLPAGLLLARARG